jgi:hypothetical protein
MNSKRLRTIDERFSRWSVSGTHPIAGAVIGLTLTTALVPGLQHVHGATGTLGPSIPLYFLVPVLLSSADGGSRRDPVPGPRYRMSAKLPTSLPRPPRRLNGRASPDPTSRDAAWGATHERTSPTPVRGTETRSCRAA